MQTSGKLSPTICPNIIKEPILEPKASSSAILGSWSKVMFHSLYFSSGRILRPPACMPKYDYHDFVNHTGDVVYIPLLQTIEITQQDAWYVDEGVASMSVYISYQTFYENFISGHSAVFYLETIFYSGNNLELGRDHSDIQGAYSQLFFYLDIIGYLEAFSGSYAWKDVLIPRGTRKLEFILWSAPGGVIGFDEIFGVMDFDAGTTSLVQTLNFAEYIAFWIVTSFIIIIPLFLFVWTKKFGKSIKFPAPIDLPSRQPHYGFLLTLFSSVSLFLFLDSWAIITRQISKTILSNIFPRMLESMRLPIVFMYHGALFYPVFLCYQLAHATRFAGVLGLISCLSLLAHALLQHIPSVIGVRNSLFGATILIQMPGYLSLVVLAVYFMGRIVDKPSASKHDQWLALADMEVLYVKRLFERNNANGDENARDFPLSWQERLWLVSTCWGWKTSKLIRTRRREFRSWHERFYAIFGIRQDIRIPFSIMVMLIMNFIMMYQIILYFIRQAFLNLGSSIACNMVGLIALSNRSPDPVKLARELYVSLVANMLISCIGGGVACMIYSTGILRRFTKDILVLRKGDYYLVKGRKKQNIIRLDDNIRFIGTGIGFGLFGCFLFISELFLIGLFFIAIYYVNRFREAFVRHVLQGTVFWSVVISLFLWSAQKLITRRVFTEDENRFVIKRRRMFFHYAYFMTFADFSVGLTSYILRMTTMAFRIAFFSIRADRTIERWNIRSQDRGFLAYLGVLLYDHHINNPIILTFVGILLQITSANTVVDRSSLTSSTAVEDGKSGHKDLVRDVTLRRKRARNKWFVAYTLIHNPSLRKTKWQLDVTEAIIEYYDTTPRLEQSSSCPSTAEVIEDPLPSRSDLHSRLRASRQAEFFR
ncbi:uncharacterized protein VTP21DRAFT_4016 [Calcarisporiella thermophila]|uniref:uncharacterized protein n=1 Tax=Calcarisporiella thermophila TaxID=911321 RepID=UPI003742B124